MNTKILRTAKNVLIRPKVYLIFFPWPLIIIIIIQHNFDNCYNGTIAYYLIEQKQKLGIKLLSILELPN